jgi:signal transduction histidine kinase
MIRCMSESLDPTVSSALPQENFNEILDSIATPTRPRAIRQGLPSEYRMRHDSHYVEDLGARTSPSRPEHSSTSPNVPTAAALRDLCQEFEGLASCFNLIQQSARPLRERLGVALAKIGVQRSIRYAQHLRLLLEDQHVSRRDVRLDEVVRQTVADFKDELRLTESNLVMDVPDVPLVVQGDPGLLLTGVRASVGAAVALAELGGAPSDLHVAAFASGDALHCEFRQDGHVVDSHQLARLFDMESSDRPGGRTLAVALSAARRVAQLHGGFFDARPASSGGCTFIFSLPRLGVNGALVKAN